MSATLKDVAQACAVDVSTASRALRDDPRVAADTRERVQAAAARLGYRVNLGARALRAGATRMMWFLTASFDSSNEHRLALAATQLLEPAGYDLLMAGHRDVPAAYERLLGRLDQGLADGALLVAGTGVHPESRALRSLLERKYPLVFLDRSPGWAGVPTVTSDNAGASRELVHRLTASGARRILSCDEDGNDVNRTRREAVLSEAAALGIDARVASRADAAWIAAAGPLGVVSSGQPEIHAWCTRSAAMLHGVELRFACFDAWTGEPYPAPVAFVAVQDFAGMARRGAERVLAAIADPAAWSDRVEHLPMLRFDEVRARL